MWITRVYGHGMHQDEDRTDTEQTQNSYRTDRRHTRQAQTKTKYTDREKENKAQNISYRQNREDRSDKKHHIVVGNLLHISTPNFGLCKNPQTQSHSKSHTDTAT